MAGFYDTMTPSPVMGGLGAATAFGQGMMNSMAAMRNFELQRMMMQNQMAYRDALAQGALSRAGYYDNYAPNREAIDNNKAANAQTTAQPKMDASNLKAGWDAWNKALPTVYGRPLAEQQAILGPIRDSFGLPAQVPGDPIPGQMNPDGTPATVGAFSAPLNAQAKTSEDFQKQVQGYQKLAGSGMLSPAGYQQAMSALAADPRYTGMAIPGARGRNYGITDPALLAKAQSAIQSGDTSTLGQIAQQAHIDPAVFANTSPVYDMPGLGASTVAKNANLGARTVNTQASTTYTTQGRLPLAKAQAGYFASATGKNNAIIPTIAPLADSLINSRNATSSAAMMNARTNSAREQVYAQVAGSNGNNINTEAGILKEMARINKPGAPTLGTGPDGKLTMLPGSSIASTPDGQTYNAYLQGKLKSIRSGTGAGNGVPGRSAAGAYVPPASLGALPPLPVSLPPGVNDVYPSHVVGGAAAPHPSHTQPRTPAGRFNGAPRQVVSPKSGRTYTYTIR